MKKFLVTKKQAKLNSVSQHPSDTNLVSPENTSLDRVTMEEIEPCYPITMINDKCFDLTTTDGRK